MKNPLEAEVQSKNESQESCESRETKNMKIQDRLFTENWCAACDEGRGVGRQHRIELMEEEE